MLTPRTLIFLFRLTAGIVCALLVVIAFGVLTDFYDLRLGLLVGFLVLAFLAWRIGYHRIILVAVALGLLFNPIVPLHIPRYIWTIIDTVVFAALLYFTHWATDSYKKGARFEQHVSTLFPEPDFAIRDRTRDISKFLGRRVESDMHPDFVFRIQKNGELCAVECKWRGRWAKGTRGEYGLWWDRKQGERYRAFEREAGMPVFVAFGIGGVPEKPKEVYFLEVGRLRYSFLTQSFIRSGRRHPCF